MLCWFDYLVWHNVLNGVYCCKVMIFRSDTEGSLWPNFCVIIYSRSRFVTWFRIVSPSCKIQARQNLQLRYNKNLKMAQQIPENFDLSLINHVVLMPNNLMSYYPWYYVKMHKRARPQKDSLSTRIGLEIQRNEAAQSMPHGRIFARSRTSTD
jgi:hypothetical protein